MLVVYLLYQCAIHSQGKWTAVNGVKSHSPTPVQENAIGGSASARLQRFLFDCWKFNVDVVSYFVALIGGTGSLSTIKNDYSSFNIRLSY